ncbi:MAG: hypothetical protein EXR27_16795 [Betaproteobacteria bacterium]|nr:hypothetical protein [Betaproteobacteria bacterium]
MTQYHFVRLFLKIGYPLAALSTAGIWLAALMAMINGTLGWGGLAAGLVVGLVTGFLLAVFADLVRIIADMLLPR